MSDPKQIAQQFLDALVANDADKLKAVLTQDAGLRVAGRDKGEAYRPRERVIARLLEESSAWRDAVTEIIALVVEANRLALQFRIQATEHQRYVEHNRAAFVTLKDDQVQMIDLYCPAPLPSARRKNWIAPATLTDDEIGRLFESLQYAWDIYEWMPPTVGGISSLVESRWGSGDAHPGSNGVANVRWTAEEADAKIARVIEYHRARNAGFTWFVSEYDTPADLRERLERHGLMLAGDQAIMGRLGLAQLDIPVNPELAIEIIDGSNDALVEAALQITAIGFSWTKEQIDERRPAWLERARNAEFRKNEIQYLASLEGKPVANARLVLRGGIAYLGGAVTLPDYRSRKIYSTMLRRRLEDAHARGYHLAAIHAEPMSRRVVKRYGFKEYAQVWLYGWMPVMDPKVIKSLVPDE